MKWEKRGLIWAPAGDLPWAQSHASLPVVQPIERDQWRGFVCCRGTNGKNRVARVVVDTTRMPDEMPTVSHVDHEPILSLGDPGTFDDSGVMPAWLIDDGDLVRLYYVGWNVSATVPYRLAIGLALSE